MSKRLSRSLAASLSLATVVSTMSFALLNEPAHASTDLPSLIAGTLVDENGAPISDGKVVVRVEREITTPVVGTLGTPIAHGVTDAAGSRSARCSTSR